MPPPPAASLSDDVTATHLQRFASFVEWPASRFDAFDAPIVVGIAGAPSLQRELAMASAGRLVKGRALQVVELFDPRQVPGVHMLMIGRGAWPQAANWVAASRARGVLVVTDMPDGLKNGAALAMSGNDLTPRFQASLPAAEVAGVRLSSRLLLLADRVIRHAP